MQNFAGHSNKILIIVVIKENSKTSSALSAIRLIIMFASAAANINTYNASLSQRAKQ